MEIKTLIQFQLKNGMNNINLALSYLKEGNRKNIYSFIQDDKGLGERDNLAPLLVFPAYEAGLALTGVASAYIAHKLIKEKAQREGISLEESAKGMGIIYAEDAEKTIDKKQENKGGNAKKDNQSGGNSASGDKGNEGNKTSKKINPKKQKREEGRKKRDNQSASEGLVKWKAKELEKEMGEKGKDARRKAHDMKEKGFGDRTKKEIESDYDPRNHR